MTFSTSPAVFFPGEFDYLRGPSESSRFKHALLYFDSILTIVPERVFVGDNYITNYFDRPQRVMQFLEETTFLREQGVLTCLNPADNSLPRSLKERGDARQTSLMTDGITDIEDFDDNVRSLLVHGIISNIEDETFRRIVDDLNLDPFPLFTGQFEINWFHGIAGYEQNRDIWHQDDLRDSRYGGFSAIVSPQLGVATLLNHALITAIRYDAVPIASNPTFAKLLRRKFERAYVNTLAKELSKWGLRSDQWNRDYLGINVANLQLPEFELSSYEDIIYIRDHCSSELMAFRDSLSQMTNSMKDCEIEHVQEITESIITSNIEPRLHDLERKLRLSDDRLIQKAFKGLTSIPGTIPLVGSLFAGLPLWVGAALSVGVAAGNAFVETYFEKRQVKDDNGLAFLLGFK